MANEIVPVTPTTHSTHTTASVGNPLGVTAFSKNEQLGGLVAGLGALLLIIVAVITVIGFFRKGGVDDRAKDASQQKLVTDQLDYKIADLSKSAERTRTDILAKIDRVEATFIENAHHSRRNQEMINAIVTEKLADSRTTQAKLETALASLDKSFTEFKADMRSDIKSVMDCLKELQGEIRKERGHTL